MERKIAATKPKTRANERRRSLLFFFFLAPVSPRCALLAFLLGYFARPLDYPEREWQESIVVTYILKTVRLL